MGRILKTLETSGQLDNSIIVFTSDHGDNLGSHRQGDKQLPFEESISVPLLLRFPERVGQGTKTGALLAPQDLMPTLLSLAGIPCHPVDGKDMLPEILDDANELQDAVLINKALALSVNWVANGNGPWCGVRTKRHTYARLTNSNTPWLLYDNAEDPYQLTNLIDHPEHRQLREQLNRRTDELLALSNEPGDPDVYARIVQDEREALGLPDRWEDLMPEKLNGAPLWPSQP
jgi:arylsulfatase A-like enzyme